MMNDKIAGVIDSYRDTALSWKLSGAGGGGYLILISEKVIPNAIRVKIRIKDYWI
jgi:mevalonate kinase